jgi:hypothetical protein
VRGCDLFEFRDGLITRKDSYFKKIVRRDATERALGGTARESRP